MPATPIKITVKWVSQPDAATKARSEIGWNYIRNDMHKYLDSVLYQQSQKAAKKSGKKSR